MLTGKQRAQLRAMANGIETIFQVGKSGIDDAFIKQVNEALNKRELIKLRVLETSPLSSKDAAAQIAAQTKAEVAQVIGSRFVLYKKSADDPKIILQR